MSYFVYILINPENNIPFYVGFGKRPDRPMDHIKETKKFINGKVLPHPNYMKLGIIKKLLTQNKLPEIEIVFRTASKAEALREEIRLIAFYGRRDLGTGSLANMSAGGIGGNGRIWSDEQKTKASKAKRKLVKQTKANPLGTKVKLVLPQVANGFTIMMERGS